jgi:2-methylcitrate dehydratase PrpD
MAEPIVAQLGKKWEILNAGFKPNPVCAFNQTPVLAMLALVRENTIHPEEVEQIRLWVSPYVYNYVALDSRGPFSTIDGTLMSTPFCLGLAAVEKEITMKGLGRFTYPQVLALINRVERIEDKALTPYACILEVQMKGGKKFRKEMIITPAYYSFGMDQTVELVKRITSETGVAQNKVDRMIALVQDLPKAGGVRPLIDVLAGCP